MSKLLATPEEELDDLSIQDWFALISLKPISGICGKQPSHFKNGAAYLNCVVI